ncbi:MAG TPA: MMPL family transporter [Bradyrhizobium sp.]|jgi:predicted RND superfamily exporter protein|nr:MMPL family transporter [Bradyrhizobium sp.]
MATGYHYGTMSDYRTMFVSPRLLQLFLRVVQARLAILGVFAVLTAAGIYGALHIPTDSSIDRLIVASDPVAQATREFERVFPEAEQALIVLEAPDPLSPAVLQGVDQLERELDQIPKVAAHSLLTLYFRSTPPATIGPSEAAKVRTFASGTSLIRRAGLMGDHYLGIGLELKVDSPAERDQALAAIDAKVLPLGATGHPFTAVRRVGSPWLDAWLEKQTGASTKKFMPLFGIFLLTLVFIVYRSWRALAAIILTLGAVVAIGVGFGELLGFSNSVVSTLVPLTIMVTTTATLVYIHSRYMEPDTAPPLEHHARALANKFLPCTASMFATAVGFAALAVSDIRPVREMGLWTACGLIGAWVACFTLFPALQSLLRAPRRSSATTDDKWFARFVDVLVPATRRYRWFLVAGAVLIMLCGAASLFGIPGKLAPLQLETDALTYVNPSEPVAQDTRQFVQTNGLDVQDLWLKTQPGHALDPEFLRSVDMLVHRLEQHEGINAVDGPTTLLRWARYIQSGSDALPTTPEAWPKLAADLEQMLLTEPGARSYVDVADLSSVRLSIRGRAEVFGRTGAMRKFILQTWTEAQAADPNFRTVHGEMAGNGVLSAIITERLLPTLTQSFAITASVIFLAFLVVFRSPSARLMTMIPSFFAILSVFIVMRVANIPLNIATILIGSTVLGATENDQVHFFYHLQEGRASGTTDGALKHAMLTAGRPILFATLINTSGFLALTLSDLPPMRQFGVVSASAFVLALIADFTALPGALWILSRETRRKAKAR